MHFWLQVYRDTPSLCVGGAEECAVSAKVSGCWAMQRRIDIEFDREFQLHTSYHNDFFLLRTKVLVNGKSTEIRTVQEGSYEGPVLMVCHSGSTSCKLWLIANAVSPILHRFGVYHVDTFYYEQSPLFHTVFSSESSLKNFSSCNGRGTDGPGDKTSLSTDT